MSPFSRFGGGEIWTVERDCGEEYVSGMPLMGALDAKRLAHLLAAKLETLPAAETAEIEAFIDKVVQRTLDADDLTQRMIRISDSSFAAVWDNPEDAIYDEL